MPTDLMAEIKSLPDLSLAQLRRKYWEVYGEENNSKHRTYLAKRIAWGLQAKEHGGLSPQAVEKIHEYADESLFRIRPPKAGLEVLARTFEARRLAASQAAAAREPQPGAILTRTFKGVEHRVEVLATGFRLGDHTYRSLSAVARAITGTNWNGRLFFGLKKAGNAT